jgi:hypothetical protein
MQDPFDALLSIMQQPRQQMTLVEAMHALKRGELERPPDEGLAAVVMAPRDSIEII